MSTEIREHHDYFTNRRWGHDYIFRPQRNGLGGSATGWGFGIKRGHVLLLQGPRGGPSPYIVQSIGYASDPKDMWFAELKYVDGIVFNCDEGDRLVSVEVPT